MISRSNPIPIEELVLAGELLADVPATETVGPATPDALCVVDGCPALRAPGRAVHCEAHYRELTPERWQTDPGDECDCREHRS